MTLREFDDLDCATTKNCLRCNSIGCLKCEQLIVFDTRECVDRCPTSYIEQWSPHTDFMGRVCLPNQSKSIKTAIFGMFGGIFVCLIIMATAFLVKRRRRFQQNVKQNPLLGTEILKYSDIAAELNEMRKYAEFFLATLNRIRSKIRKLYLTGDIEAANSKFPLVCDLAKILFLINSPAEIIQVARNDWNRAQAWMAYAIKQENNITRSKAFSAPVVHGVREHSTTATDWIEYNFLRQRTLMDFNVPIMDQNEPRIGSILALNEICDPCHSKTLRRHSNVGINSSMPWLEDECFELGFRPQDEITTEL